MPCTVIVTVSAVSHAQAVDPPPSERANAGSAPAKIARAEILAAAKPPIMAKSSGTRPRFEHRPSAPSDGIGIRATSESGSICTSWSGTAAAALPVCKRAVNSVRAVLTAFRIRVRSRSTVSDTGTRTGTIFVELASRSPISRSLYGSDHRSSSPGRARPSRSASAVITPMNRDVDVPPHSAAVAFHSSAGHSITTYGGLHRSLLPATTLRCGCSGLGAAPGDGARPIPAIPSATVLAAHSTIGFSSPIVSSKSSTSPLIRDGREPRSAARTLGCP